MTIHAHGERFDSTGDKEAVHGSKSRACGALKEVNFLGVFLAGENRGAGDAVAVAVEVLGHGMDDDVSAESERLLEIRAEESVVHYHCKILVARERRNGGEIGDDHGGIRRSLDVNHFGRRAQCFLDLLQTRSVNETELHAELNEKLGGEAVDSAINGARQNGVVARTEQSKDRIDCRHAGSENVGGDSAFELGDGAFESFAIGVVGARVVVTFIVAEGFLDVRGRLIDRSDDGTGGGIGLLPYVNRVG